jgi:hypothetical protein
MSTALPAYDIYYRAMLLAAEMALPYHGVPDPDETDSEQPVEPDSPEPSPNSPVLSWHRDSVRRNPAASGDEAVQGHTTGLLDL